MKCRWPAIVLALFAFTAIQPLAASSEEKVWRTSTSLIGKSKYEDKEFKHYDHVNPQAPKGGTIQRTATGNYDSFNGYIVPGNPAGGLGYLYDTIMQQSIDEPSTSHPLIAEAFTFPADYSSATYRLNKAARWHDGKPITTADVKFSMETLKEHSPQYNRYFADIKEMRIDSDREITFIFAEKGNRELPLIIGDLPVLPKHWWEEAGKDRDFSKSTLEVPLGNGPYKVSKFKAGSSIEYERVKDYWAANTPTRVGRFNADFIKYTYFGDENAQFEAFKKGGFQDVRVENRAQFWAERYNFPSFKDGDVKKQIFKETSGFPMQGWVLNTRREQFKDRRVRKALTWAMNFEFMNETLFFNQYTRINSYFGGSELQSSGLPQGQELEILNAYKDQLPPEIFSEKFELPIYASRRDERKYLKIALDLLTEAGWKRQGSKLVDANGKQFKLVILGSSPASERVNAPWLKNLRRLGIDASFQVVDTSQWISRAQSFDFDVISIGLQQSQSPGNEQRNYWGSKSANKNGSRNQAGISDPVVDALIDKIIYAKDRAELVATTNALDRVLLHGYYYVPQWYLAADRVAYWDKFGIPETQPSYVGHDVESWWIIPEKEAALKAKYR